MQAKLLHESREKTYVLVFDKGDEFMAGMREFAQQHDLDAAFEHHVQDVSGIALVVERLTSTERSALEGGRHSLQLSRRQCPQHDGLPEHREIH